MRSVNVAAALLFLSGAIAMAQRVEIIPPSVTLRDLVGTPTLVTVLIKGSEAEDANLRVAAIEGDYVAFLNKDGQRIAYLYDSIGAIRVQGGEVDKPEFELVGARKLRADELAIVERAGVRAQEIFAAASAQQDVRIKAAVLLALGGNREASDYLFQVSRSGDLESDLNGAIALYLAGDTRLRLGALPPGTPMPEDAVSATSLIRAGLEESNRRLRARAALLAGLLRDRDAIPRLLRLLQDRAVELSVPSAFALARMQQEEAIPELMNMLLGLNTRKGEAAIEALALIDGSEVADQVNAQVKSAGGEVLFRLARLLYKLQDPNGRRLLVQTMQELPTLKMEASLLLAREGDWDSMQVLRSWIEQRRDETEENFIAEAKAAAALLEGGDNTAVSTLQRLLRHEKDSARTAACEAIIRLNQSKTLTILQPTIESGQPDIALKACSAVMALANEEYRERLLAYMEAQ